MKGQINIGNIGWYLLQAQEGNLSAHEMDTLCVFLELHPELVPETEPFFTAVNDVEISPSFAHLKKDDFELGSFDMLAVEVLEGECHESNLNEVLSENNNHSREWQAFKHTKLLPEAIIIPNKQKLYRHRVQVLWLRYAAAACIAILVFGLGWMAISSRGESEQWVNKQGIPTKKQVRFESRDFVLPKPAEAPKKLVASQKPSFKNIQNTIKPEMPKKQVFAIEVIETTERVQLQVEMPELTLIENSIYTYPLVEQKVEENVFAHSDEKVWTRVLRNIWPGKEKPQTLPELDWVNVLANAGNQGLDQISKGRIEFSYQPERNNGPEAYLKIGNFSISRSIASN